MHLAEKYNLYVIEGAAQAINSYYKGLSLGKMFSTSSKKSEHSFFFEDVQNIFFS